MVKKKKEPSSDIDDVAVGESTENVDLSKSMALLIPPLLLKQKTLSCQNKSNRGENRDMYLSETYEKKWAVLEHADLPKIGDSYTCIITTILENQERAMKEDSCFLKRKHPTNATGLTISNWDPILISLVRRAMPNLIAYDIKVYKL